MIDLTKPIRRRDDKRPALSLALPDGTFCIACERPDGRWHSGVFQSADDITNTFENVPPPQEWRWRYDGGQLGTVPFSSADAARRWANDVIAGKPVRILREGETP